MTNSANIIMSHKKLIRHAYLLIATGLCLWYGASVKWRMITNEWTCFCFLSMGRGFCEFPFVLFQMFHKFSVPSLSHIPQSKPL